MVIRDACINYIFAFMRKTLTKAILALTFILSWGISLHAQSDKKSARSEKESARSNPAGKSNFEGIVEYSMQFEGKDLSPEIRSMMPKEFTIYVKNSHSRLEMQTGMTDITVLGDNVSNSAVTLMNIMGNKVAIKTDSTQLNKALGQIGKFEIQYLEGKKEILGYDCKKALIIRESDTSEVWYTNELLPIYPAVNQFLPEGDWFPMEVRASQHGVGTIVTVEAIKEIPLADSLFEVPEGYKVMEQDMIRQKLQGL